MTNLWFSPGPAGPVRVLGNTLHSLHGPEVWAVQHRKDSGIDNVPNEVAELPPGLGGAVHGIGYALTQLGAELPESLRFWAVAPDVPAEAIGSGRPTLMVVAGQMHLALSWQYDTLVATFAIVRNRYLTTISPVASGHVVLEELTTTPVPAW